MQQIIFIADFIACSTCFGQYYTHHQELESIIQMVAACGIWCFGFQVVGMVWSWRLCVRFATGCLRQPTLPLSIRINTGSLYRNVSILNYKRDKDNVS